MIDGCDVDVMLWIAVGQAVAMVAGPTTASRVALAVLCSTPQACVYGAATPPATNKDKSQSIGKSLRECLVSTMQSEHCKVNRQVTRAKLNHQTLDRRHAKEYAITNNSTTTCYS